jgi:hypothetical protein
LSGAAGGVLSSLEEQAPTLSAWVPVTLFPSRQDPQVAQVILSATDVDHDRRLHRLRHPADDADAGLDPVLTAHPGQLRGATAARNGRWGVSRHLLPVAGCAAAARSLPVVFVPVLTVTGAMLLALVAVGWLIFFIHHISQAISVNHIVDRIARETELVIDELMPRPRTRFERISQGPPDDTNDTAILNQRSGYVRFVDVGQLLYLQIRHHIRWSAAWASSFRWRAAVYVSARTGGDRCP